MSEYQPANLENLFVKRAGRRMRVGSSIFGARDYSRH